jgi:hypothetical protein
MELPTCLDCKHADQGFPCHKADGSYDFAKVAKAVVLLAGPSRRTARTSGRREEQAWAADCAYEVEQAAAAADGCGDGSL